MQEWWVECGAKLDNGSFKRNIIVRENEVNKVRFSYGNKGVFVTTYKYDTKDFNNSLLMGDFYLDLDSENIDEVIADTKEAIKRIIRFWEIEPDAFDIFYSGQKGFHIIVPSYIFNVQPRSDLNKIYKSMATDINESLKHKTIDLSIYDKRRLFRLPNSIHPKTYLYKIPITYEELNTLSADEIKNLAKEPRPIRKKKLISSKKAEYEFNRYAKIVETRKPGKPYNGPQTKFDYIPPCITTILSYTNIGSRNNSGAGLASFYRQCGMDKEECLAKMTEWNQKCCDPPMENTELCTIVESVYRGSYKMGCSWMNNVVDCEKESCKLCRKRR